MQEPPFSMATPRTRSSATLAAAIGAALDPVERETLLRRISGLVRAAAGTVVSVSGQSLMADFDSAAEAFACALRIQGDPMQARMVRIGLAADGPQPMLQQPGAVVVLAQQLRAVSPIGGIALPSALYADLSDMLPLPATQMAQPILGELSEPVAAVTISAADCAAWNGGSDDPAAASQQDERTTLAIVPMRAATRQIAAFADAVTDDAIRVLGGSSRWIGVTRVPMTSPGGTVDLRQIRQICDARYVLHGSAEKEQRALRLTVELNEAPTGRVLWSDRFDNAAGDAGALRDVCAPRVAGAVARGVIQRELERTAPAPLSTLSAQDLALRAVAAILQPERASFGTAAEWLQTGLTRPGPHGSIYYGLVIWHMMAIAQGWSNDPNADANAAAETAKRLDRNEPASLALLGYVQAVLHREFTLASATLDRVIDQAPFCSAAWSMKARVLIQMGDGAAAVFHADQSEALPSLGFDSAWRNTVTALAYYAAERYAEAVHWARTAALNHAGLAMTFRVLSASLVVLGQLDDAQQAAQRMLAIDPGFRIATWRLRSALSADLRDRYAQRLRLAGLPE